MNNYPIYPDERLYFFSTINREETGFECDMSQDHGAKLECVVLSGVHKGETRMFPTLSLMTLWEQQNAEEDAA